jgi:hypothetical protein
MCSKLETLQTLISLLSVYSPENLIYFLSVICPRGSENCYFYLVSKFGVQVPFINFSLKMHSTIASQFSQVYTITLNLDCQHVFHSECI